MQWLSQNWVWVLFFVAFIGMHLFGHGCHGRHGGRPDVDKNSAPTNDDDSRRSSGRSGHHHH